MKIVHSPAEVRQDANGNIVAIGKWDGVHLGHQYLVRQLVSKARQASAKSIVISFDPHPVAVLRPGSEPRLLQSVGERSDWLAACGVDYHLVLPFTPEFAQVPPEIFVQETLLKGLGAREVMVGYNFRFGRERKGTPELLEHLCAPHGVEVIVVPPIYVDGELVSSTVIRQHLEIGDVERAGRLLGRPAVLFGQIRTGRSMSQRDTSLYHQLLLDPGRQVPASGEYYIEVSCISAEGILQEHAGRLIVDRFDEKAQCWLQLQCMPFEPIGHNVRVKLLQRK